MKKKKTFSLKIIIVGEPAVGKVASISHVRLKQV